MSNEQGAMRDVAILAWQFTIGQLTTTIAHC